MKPGRGWKDNWQTEGRQPANERRERRGRKKNQDRFQNYTPTSYTGKMASAKV